ncbi:MAG: hypothetical protein ACERLG_03260 [Sedimentibacter sp.]
MKIGIKYCGGCNPKYNRTNLLKCLKDEYNDASFETAKDDVYYDVVIVLCGCSSACANHEKLIGRRKIIITDENDCIKAKQIISELNNCKIT